MEFFYIDWWTQVLETYCLKYFIAQSRKPLNVFSRFIIKLVTFLAHIKMHILLFQGPHIVNTHNLRHRKRISIQIREIINIMYLKLLPFSIFDIRAINSLCTSKGELTLQEECECLVELFSLTCLYYRQEFPYVDSIVYLWCACTYIWMTMKPYLNTFTYSYSTEASYMVPTQVQCVHCLVVCWITEEKSNYIYRHVDFVCQFV